MDVLPYDYNLLDDLEEGRTIAIAYNASTTVFYLTIALGVFFTATAIGLIIYYFTTLGGGSSTFGRSFDDGWSAPNARVDTLPWLRVLADRT
ncbi:uncharacterized protein LOC125179042 [Hyalella azteca]|uniref:Uncharacterized protein LOC125179042 n=1 Tax=Hyalella azteca TaxID=294128 RepID=A0A979FSD9_HYAAZ|nr:uncharacterized protein LOC125179042 [Hyalella azteca]